jgi:hypothetical protein
VGFISSYAVCNIKTNIWAREICVFVWIFTLGCYCIIALFLFSSSVYSHFFLLIFFLCPLLSFLPTTRFSSKICVDINVWDRLTSRMQIRGRVPLCKVLPAPSSCQDPPSFAPATITSLHNILFAYSYERHSAEPQAFLRHVKRVLDSEILVHDARNDVLNGTERIALMCEQRLFL